MYLKFPKTILKIKYIHISSSLASLSFFLSLSWIGTNLKAPSNGMVREKKRSSDPEFGLAKNRLAESWGQVTSKWKKEMEE